MRDRIVINVIGFYLLLWVLVLITVPIVIFYSALSSTLLKSIVYVACAGGLGGVVYLIRSFYKHLFEKNFRTDVVWWYVFRPLLSIVIGVISYFLIVGGLLSLGNISDVDYERSVMFYSGIAFLAGFSFTEFADKLEDLAKTVFAKTEKKK